MDVYLNKNKELTKIGRVPVKYNGVRVFRQKRIHSTTPDQKIVHKPFEIKSVNTLKSIIIEARKDIRDYFPDLKPII